MKKLSGILAIMIVLTLSLAGCGGSDSKGGSTAKDEGSIPETIVVGTNAEFAPFEYVNDAGEVDGFDIALMKAVCDKLGVKMEVENMEFKSLLGSMQMESIDVIAAGMTVTEERLQSVDFTDEYYEAKQVIVVNKDSKVAGFSDLDGKAIAVQEGTTGDFLVSPEEEGALVKDATVKRMKKHIDGIMDLKNGGVDAVVVDKNPALEFVENDSSIKIVEDEAAVENYALAVHKGNKVLADAINKALAELKEDGTYDELIKTYIND